MQQTTNQKSMAIATIKRSSWLPAAISIVSVAVMLTAIFSLANWAEISVLHHGIQHVLIFASGLGVGSSLTSIYQSKRSRESES